MMLNGPIRLHTALTRPDDAERQAAGQAGGRWPGEPNHSMSGWQVKFQAELAPPMDRNPAGDTVFVSP